METLFAVIGVISVIGVIATAVAQFTGHIKISVVVPTK